MPVGNAWHGKEKPEMSHRRARAWFASLGFAVSLALSGPAIGSPWQAPPADVPPPLPLPVGDQEPQGAEVLTRGPLHEAFAEPVVFDPKPGPVVPKQPPAPIEEAPPDQKPEGVNVQWIPGYWAWDDGRTDFIWISGLWRDVPPGRQWVPGYWAPEGGGFRWVTGTWAADQPAAAVAATQAVSYLPAPPASLEAGPSSPTPTVGAVWAPGSWLWQPNRYVWRPGFWIAYQPDWIWVPAHYIWTPGGYLFVDGYWDRSLARRGTPFAPVYFAQPIYARPRFVYTPTISLMATALVTSLFVRPACHQYYFGDYYATTYVTAGIYPAYSFHQSRYGYDPVFAHDASVNMRRDPAWLDHVHEDYRFRRDHPEFRPPHTYAAMREAYNRPAPVGTVINQTTVNITRNLVIARPISQVAANPHLLVGEGARPGPDRPQPPRFTRITEERRQETGRQAVQLRQFREERQRQEVAAAGPHPREGALPGATAPPLERSRQLNFARSPIAAGATAGQPHPTPPRAPAVDLGARPQPGGATRIRPEPNPDQRPRTFPDPNAQQERLRQDQERKRLDAVKAQQDQLRRDRAKTQPAPPKTQRRPDTTKKANPDR
jgi:WXXGXW repeat (2 copies)